VVVDHALERRLGLLALLGALPREAGVVRRHGVQGVGLRDGRALQRLGGRRVEAAELELRHALVEVELGARGARGARRRERRLGRGGVAGVEARDPEGEVEIRERRIDRLGPLQGGDGLRVPLQADLTLSGDERHAPVAGVQASRLLEERQRLLAAAGGGEALGTHPHGIIGRGPGVPERASECQGHQRCDEEEPARA
jgi:hypothetical protein